jgi:hypothetical protein
MEERSKEELSHYHRLCGRKIWIRISEAEFNEEISNINTISNWNTILSLHICIYIFIYMSILSSTIWGLSYLRYTNPTTIRKSTELLPPQKKKIARIRWNKVTCWSCIHTRERRSRKKLRSWDLRKWSNWPNFSCKSSLLSHHFTYIHELLSNN